MTLIFQIEFLRGIPDPLQSDVAGSRDPYCLWLSSLRPLLTGKPKTKQNTRDCHFFVPFVKFHALQAYKQNEIMGHGGMVCKICFVQDFLQTVARTL
jgi:hypothetical protein